MSALLGSGLGYETAGRVTQTAAAGLTLHDVARPINVSVAVMQRIHIDVICDFVGETWSIPPGH